MNPALLALVDEMRKRGVRSFAFEGLSVEFAVETPVVEPMKRAVDLDLCRCGHSHDVEHQNGICIRGCEPQTCAGPEVK